MDINQLNHHQHSSLDVHSTEVKPTPTTSFEGELEFATSETDLYKIYKSDGRQNKELEEQVEEKRRNDDQENAIAMAFWNNQKLEDQQQQHQLEKEFGFKLVKSESEEKLNSQKAVLAQSANGKSKADEITQERTATRKAHLIAPLTDKAATPENGKGVFSEALLKSSEKAQPMADQVIDSSLKIPEKGLEGDYLKQMAQQNQARVDRNGIAFKLDGNPEQSVKINSGQSSSKQMMSDLGNPKEQMLTQQRPTRNSATIAKTFATEMNAMTQDSQKIDSTQVAKQVKETANHEANVKEVANNLRILMSSGKDSVIIRLTPEHLGKLEIRLKKNGETLKGEFKVESAEARKILETELPLLREELESQGIKVEEFSFIVKEDQEESAFGQQFAHDQQPEGRTSPKTDSDLHTDAELTEQAPATTVSQNHENSGLNILA